MPFYNTKNSLFILMTLTLFIITFSIALTASPLKGEEKLTGKWYGIVTDKKYGDVKIDLTIKPDSVNTNSNKYSLHYGAPRSCRLETEELSADDNIIILKFNEASDIKFCNVLLKENGKITITINIDHKLGVVIESNSGFKQTATLKKK